MPDAQRSPPDPNVLFRQVKALRQAGKVNEAATLCKKLLIQLPGNPLLLTELGILTLHLGNTQESIRLLESSLLAAPDQHEALFSLGVALGKLNRLEEALACHDRATALAPDFAEGHNERGNILQLLKRLEEALVSYDYALALKPDYAAACCNRAAALQLLKRPDEALAGYDRAISLKPDHAEAFYNRGNLLKELAQPDAAIASYERAIALKPEYLQAYNNLGQTLQDMGSFDKALATYNHAIALKPDYAGAQWNKSLLKLLTGDFEEGWLLYEWRKKYLPGVTRHFTQPLWLGYQPIQGKTLLIHAEQGLGDVIQFCRYAPMAEALGAKVVIEVPAALAPLLESLPGNPTIAVKGQPLPVFDLHCPIMSLPLAFKTTLANIPASASYLHASPNRRAAWQERLGAKKRFRVGLAWSGAAIHKNDHNRSIPLRLLEPLLQLPFEFHAIQKEIRDSDAVDLTRFSHLRLHRKQLHDFADTAALIEEMDLVISVDTSVAHLAGALGKPLWLLLPRAADFRWLVERTDSPWYPGATLFRQQQDGDWAGVITAAALQLHTKA